MTNRFSKFFASKPLLFTANILIQSFIQVGLQNRYGMFANSAQQKIKTANDELKKGDNETGLPKQRR